MMNNELVLLALEAAVKAGIAILDVYRSPFAVEHKEDRSPLTLADKNAHKVIAEMLRETGIPLLSEEGKIIPFSERSGWKELWIVDPLDGTKEFIKRNGEFTVNIAFVKDGIALFGVIYQPVTGLLYYGEGNAAYRIKDASGRRGSQLLRDQERLDSSAIPETYTVVASRSHLSPETSEFIDDAKKTHGQVDLISSGSSLKLCMVAEGKAHVYPRFAPTMEWDTAAGHAIVKAAGKNVYAYSTGEELRYNKPDLLNDWFIAK